MTRPRTSRQFDELLARLPSSHAPFSAREAEDAGLTNRQCRDLVDRGALVWPIPGVYYRHGVEDSQELRLAALRLIVPSDCVVTDRTAAWLWLGDRALAPGEHLTVPRVSVFAPPGRRLRNGLVDSGERRLALRDAVEVNGVLATTPLRTACDLGRLLHRDQALAALDALASLCSVEEIAGELPRFKGFRGVIQARMLVSIADAGAASPFESIARLRWWDAGLPRPQCQVPVDAPDGGRYYIDIGLPEERFGLEYFGEEFHGPSQRSHDRARLLWLRERRDWILTVARRRNVVGRGQDLPITLRRRWDAAGRIRRRAGGAHSAA
ncbi:hypothetical protein [Nocardioides sp. GXZ039]|uniref:hypothetical protein n=1 Tax=Nocardioides sp. GXZ039 TaxID=3136018 RepID=UPI0030F4ACA4